MNVEQLADFLRSEIALQRQTDKQIAAYLKKVHLTEQLPDKVIVDLEAQGAGPKTIDALKKLREQTASMKPPAHDATYSPDTAPPDSGATAKPSGPRISTASPIPPPDSVKQAAMIDAAREYATNYTSNLPNFVCVEVMRRYAQLVKWDDYKSIGSVLERVSYNHGQEDYKVYSVNNQYVDTPLSKLGGPLSTGEFGSIMHHLFSVAGQAEINWDHWATLRGRRMAVFNYSMDSAHSDLTLSDEVGSVHAGAKGLFYLDPESGAISRITEIAFDIPPDFSIHAADRTLDYDNVEISGNQYLVPTRVMVHMSTSEGRVKLAIEFRSYRKFGTEEQITYGDVKDAENSQPAPETQPEEQPKNNNNPFGLPTAPPPPPK